MHRYPLQRPMSRSAAPRSAHFRQLAAVVENCHHRPRGWPSNGVYADQDGVRGLGVVAGEEAGRLP